MLFYGFSRLKGSKHCLFDDIFKSDYHLESFYNWAIGYVVYTVNHNYMEFYLLLNLVAIFEMFRGGVLSDIFMELWFMGMNWVYFDILNNIFNLEWFFLLIF